MARRGLNCTLSYKQKGKERVYRVRCSGLTYGFEQIATESAARTQRGFYPKQVAPTRFTLQIDLIGKAERSSFNIFMTNYANYILDPGLAGTETPQMTASIPSRSFKRIGVPLTGPEYGDRTGQAWYQPTVTFEISGEPLDWSSQDVISTVRQDLAFLNAPSTKYFYPTGLQLRGDQAPVGSTFNEIQDILIGGVASGANGGAGTTVGTGALATNFPGLEDD